MNVVERMVKIMTIGMSPCWFVGGSTKIAVWPGGGGITPTGATDVVADMKRRSRAHQAQQSTIQI